MIRDLPVFEPAEPAELKDSPALPRQLIQRPLESLIQFPRLYPVECILRRFPRLPAQPRSAPRSVVPAGSSPAASSSRTHDRPAIQIGLQRSLDLQLLPPLPKTAEHRLDRLSRQRLHPSAPSTHTHATAHTSRRTVFQKPAHPPAHRIGHLRDRSLPNNGFNSLKLPDFSNKTREIDFTLSDPFYFRVVEKALGVSGELKSSQNAYFCARSRRRGVRFEGGG